MIKLYQKHGETLFCLLQRPCSSNTQHCSWQGISVHAGQKTELDAVVLVPFQEQHRQCMVNATASGLLEPDQSYQENIY